MKNIFALALLSLLFMACANKSTLRYEALSQSLRKGGFEGAIKEVEKEHKDLYGEKSVFLYHFDLGTLHHYNRNWDASIEHFAKAEQVYDDLFTKSVTNEAAAVVTNDNTRPYRAKPFELLLLHQFQILNFLAKNDLNGASVEVKRAQMAMESLYQKDAEKANDNGFLYYLSAIVYEMNGEDDDAAIAYYKAAKAYLENEQRVPNQVLEFVSANLQKAGRENDLAQLKITLLEENPTANDLKAKGAEIIVIGYAGQSPILGELYVSGTLVSGAGLNLTYKDGQTGQTKAFTMLAPIVAGTSGAATFHVGFSLPEKKVLPFDAYDFSVFLNDQPEITPEEVRDLNQEITRNLSEDFSGIAAKTALRVVLRTIAAQQAKKAMKTSNPLLNLATSLGTDVAQTQLEKADLRIGLFMPNRLYMTRIPVEPGEHDLLISALDSRGGTVSSYDFKHISVKKGQKTFLFAPAIR